ncbi:hypothetical protein PybrP1_009562 [[Pythium] brassicae (nom. inval.)]|nr:hypothetical protein PybrP1_009562 [[Pythium] brassicae (nom. inval.)]
MKKAPILQIGGSDTSYTRAATTPIAMANRRMAQSVKEQRDQHFSAHHVRQMAKLSQARAQPTQGAPLSKATAMAPQVVGASSPKSTIGSRSSAVNSLDPKKHVENAFKVRPSTAAGTPLVPRPMSSNAFKPRKIEPTRFRYFYDRGDLPLRVNFAGAVRKLQWQVNVAKLDFSHYLPIFMEGLRDLDEPYHFLALNGTMDLLEKGENRVLACVAHLVLPMKQNLSTRNPAVLCVQLKVLQRMVQCCPYVGEALVPYYRQLLSVFNLFITKRVNCGDAIDYGQRRQENLGDLILETLNLLESSGGPDAFVNINSSLELALARCCPVALRAMKKSRPVLALLEVEGEVRAPSKARAFSSKPGHSQRKAVESDDDGSDSVGNDEEIDELENSCDIGETTLRKGPIHINHAGVTFVPKPQQQRAAVDDDSLYRSRRTVSGGGQRSAWHPRVRARFAANYLISLDELETLGLIGRGCSGHVVRARHQHTDALYAVKLVNNVHDKAKRDQMLTEIRTLYSVESPFLVDFYGAYFKDHALSLVLEYCEAGSLDKVIARQRRAIPERVIAAMARTSGASGSYSSSARPSASRRAKHHRMPRADAPGRHARARVLGRVPPLCQPVSSQERSCVCEGVVLGPRVHTLHNKDERLTVECTRRWVVLQAQKRASVQELLGSAWLRTHGATDGPSCIRTCGAWFARGSSRHCDGGKDGDNMGDDSDSYDDDDDEIEEEIE